MGLSTVDAFKHIRSGQEGIVELSEEELSRLQRLLNGMLGDLAECCGRHGLEYVLGGGSCLGAVRHHGFIPWDDDVDVNMPRADHDRFVRVFQEEYGDRYWVHTPKKTDGYALTFTRILRKGTSVRTREDFRNEECGAFIDIFVIENTYDRIWQRKLHGLGCMALGFVQSCAKFRRDRKELTALAQSIEDAEERKRTLRTFRVKIAFGMATSFRSIDTWTRAADRMYSRCADGGSEFVTIPSGRGHFFRETYHRADLLPGIPMEYDGGTRQVPADYDLYLTRLYGDYSVLPPQDQRERHIFFAPFQI